MDQPIFQIAGRGEYGIDPEHSPGVGAYYVKLYDGSYDSSGFETEQEARAELDFFDRLTYIPDFAIILVQ